MQCDIGPLLDHRSVLVGLILPAASPNYVYSITRVVTNAKTAGEMHLASKTDHLMFALVPNDNLARNPHMPWLRLLRHPAPIVGSDVLASIVHMRCITSLCSCACASVHVSNLPKRNNDITMSAPSLSSRMEVPAVLSQHKL
ncbi:hypothetical protein FIBSPDRAFT_262003 [Athelia psychrophila]|uniref:Uncharacterized protein n=1 Tax=Athelia psychrophila TaxID=1759441 RepID=A0A165XER8_9AGAM|nr:hypothetical protein FIBSPDRAFT_262003 [Fibularhizoctonia sp. CBS 109695]